MKGIIASSLVMFSATVQASEWVPLRDYDLHQLYSGEISRAMGVATRPELVGTSGLSWPDGRKATITYLEIERDQKHWLYKCVETWTSDLQLIQEQCFELKR